MDFTHVAVGTAEPLNLRVDVGFTPQAESVELIIRDHKTLEEHACFRAGKLAVWPLNPDDETLTHAVCLILGNVEQRESFWEWSQDMAIQGKAFQPDPEVCANPVLLALGCAVAGVLTWDPPHNNRKKTT